MSSLWQWCIVWLLLSTSHFRIKESWSPQAISSTKTGNKQVPTSGSRLTWSGRWNFYMQTKEYICLQSCFSIQKIDLFSTWQLLSIRCEHRKERQQASCEFLHWATPDFPRWRASQLPRTRPGPTSCGAETPPPPYTLSEAINRKERDTIYDIQPVSVYITHMTTASYIMDFNVFDQAHLMFDKSCAYYGNDSIVCTPSVVCQARVSISPLSVVIHYDLRFEFLYYCH